MALAPRRWLDSPLLGATALSLGILAALAWSAFDPSSYRRLVSSSLSAKWTQQLNVASFHDVVVNVAMTLFFYAIGLELARERRRGILADTRQAFAPIGAAVGGMVATVIISLLIAAMGHVTPLRAAWGVPMSTDVAFALAVIAAFRSRLPRDIRVFVLALAVADDVLGVVVLAVQHASHLRVLALALLMLALITLVVTRRAPISGSRRWLAFLILIGLSLAANIETAVVAVVAGVLHQDFTAARDQLERRVVRAAAMVSLPLFGLVAGGLTWSRALTHGVAGRVVIGTVIARLVGKTIGILAGTAVALACGARLSAALRWRHLVGVGLLCAVGITVPLFFAGATYAPGSTTYSAFTLGLLVASFLAAGFGALWLGVGARKDTHEDSTD